MESSQLLPDDCWEMVIKHLDIQADQLQLDQLSLVSKQLLSVTNQLLPSLKVFDRTKLFLPVYFHRFPQVKMIDLSDFSGEITCLLHDLAHSNLNLEGLDLSNQESLPLEDLKEIASNKRNLKALKCSRLSFLQDSELIAIGDAFPSLEELDISYPSHCSVLTDNSITALSTKLPNLGKINLSGNSSLSDECLKSLSTNCGKLREVILHHCVGMTQDGLAFLVKNNPNLVTLSLSLSLSLPEGIFPATYIPFAGLRFLHTLELFYMDISDLLLFHIADAKMPLKTFALCHCQEFTFVGVMYFLQTYHSLKSISLADVDFLDDFDLSLFSEFFKGMTSIKLNFCPKLTDQAFSILLGTCPYLENLKMARTLLGIHYRQDFFEVNQKLEWLNLSGNQLLWEGKLKRIAIMCPNLMYLDLSGCMDLKKGIIYILENCKKIRHLQINGVQGIRYVEGTSKYEKLQTLQAARSDMDDQSLSMFARRSPNLRNLNLKACKYVTVEGLRNVLLHCVKLVEINISGCNVKPEFVEWMVKCRPQLKHIVPPDYRQNLLLNPFLRLSYSYFYD